MTRVVRPRLFSGRTLILLVACAMIAAPASMGARQSSAAPPQSVPPDVDVNRDWSDDVPAHLAVVEGSATLERDGRVELAVQNAALLAGDRLHTERGRVDVMFADGSALDLDQNTSVEFLSDEMLRLSDGRVRMTLTRATADGYRIDSAGTTSFLLAAGEYRLSVSADRAGDPQVTLTVARGSAELSTMSGRSMVRAGMASIASAGSSPSVPYAVAVASVDAFDRWADQQHTDRVGLTSTQYLPADLRYYGGDFDRNGTWGYVAPYGYVWYPTVAAGWQPYYAGGWSFYANFGWMWVGAGSWVWPTHHYGRWGYAGSWYWIPDHHWGPSWVAWGGAPGYVGWCPLGYNNHAVFSVGVGFSYGYGYGYGYGHGHGWAVAPAHAFNGGYGGYGARVVPIDGRAVTGTAVSRFAAGRAPGQPAGFAAARNTAPLRAPSVATARATAQPRGGDVRSGAAGNARPDGAGVRDMSARDNPSRFAAPRNSIADPGASSARAAVSRDTTPGATRSVMPPSAGFARSRDAAGPSASDQIQNRPAPSRTGTPADPSRTWTPSSRIPSRVMEPDARGSLNAAPRGVDTPTRNWSAPSAPPATSSGPSRFPSSRPGSYDASPYSVPRSSLPAQPYGGAPSRNWSSPGEYRAVAPSARPDGPSRMPAGPSMSAPPGGGAPMSRGGVAPRASAPSGPSGNGSAAGAPAHSRGGRR